MRETLAIAEHRIGAHLTSIDQANLLAGHAVAYATAFLDGRHDEAQLASHANKLQLELMAANDPATNAILDPVRLLNIAMMRAAIAQGEARQDRWQQVMGSLVELVRHESVELRINGTGS